MKFKHVSEDLSQVEDSYNWKSKYFAIFAGTRYLMVPKRRKDIVVSVWFPEDIKRTIYPYFVLPCEHADLLLPLAFHVMQELLSIPDEPSEEHRVRTTLMELSSIYGNLEFSSIPSLSERVNHCVVDVSLARRNLKALRKGELCQTSPLSIELSEIDTSTPG